MAGAGATAAAPWRGPPGRRCGLFPSFGLSPSSGPPRPPSDGQHRDPARRGKTPAPLPGEEAGRGRRKGGYWGWQPGGGKAPKSPLRAWPLSRCRYLSRAVPAQPPHTVLDPAQASAKALVKILREAGDLALPFTKGSGEVQVHNGRFSTRLPGQSVSRKFVNLVKPYFPLVQPY